MTGSCLKAGGIAAPVFRVAVALGTALGITNGTVSRALNECPDVSEATRRRVRRTAVEIGFRPLAQAERTRIGRTRTLGPVLQTDIEEAQVSRVRQWNARPCPAMIRPRPETRTGRSGTRPDARDRARRVSTSCTDSVGVALAWKRDAPRVRAKCGSCPSTLAAAHPPRPARTFALTGPAGVSGLTRCERGSHGAGVRPAIAPKPSLSSPAIMVRPLPHEHSGERTRLHCVDSGRQGFRDARRATGRQQPRRAAPIGCIQVHAAFSAAVPPDAHARNGWTRRLSCWNAGPVARDQGRSAHCWMSRPKAGTDPKKSEMVSQFMLQVPNPNPARNGEHHGKPADQ